MVFLLKKYSKNQNHPQYLGIFVITIFWLGAPIKGVAFGLVDGDDEGVNVQNTKLVVPSEYLYLTDFWRVFVKFCVTGSQKKDEVIIL